MIDITPNISIHEDEIQESFIRSSGPGGQNVNKVETAVQIRFDARHSRNIPTYIYARLKELAGQRMTKEGVIIITANEFRSQVRNRQEARDRLCELIRQSTIEQKSRRPTKPSRAAKTKRTDQKKQRGTIKKNRGRVSNSDY